MSDEAPLVPEFVPVKAPILIVDDKPHNLVVLTEILRSLGEEVIEAHSGNEVLRVLMKQDVAILLIDVQMPDMDGYELATLIRKRERSRSTPIIFITAHDRDAAEVSRGYALGAVDYVFKPVDAVILRAKVAVFVDLFRKTEAIRERANLEKRLMSENLRVRTEKIEAEMALRQVEERQALIVKSLPIALYNADLKGGFAGPRFLSESIARLVGFDAADFALDRDLWAARIHPDDLPKVLSEVASIIETGSLSIEYRWRCKDGSERVFLDQAVLIEGPDPTAKEIFGTCLDVTYRRQLEEQLLQSQKMEAIGQLTGGIAHDFNNMLSVIIWNLDLLSRALQGSGKNYDRVQNALGGALNCAELIRQLLDFARDRPRQAQVVDLAQLLPRLARMLGPVIGETIAIKVALGGDLWRTFVDPAQIDSAIVNLAINGRDAMAEGGTLTIAAANIRPEDFLLEAGQSDYVMLAVTDTGCGMAPEVIERVFEPFFTTKGPGKGSGLGLSMVYGFVKQSGGHIRIESRPEEGTTVRLFLPRTDILVPLADPGAALVPPPRPPARRILVVEDNANVRHMAVARLEELGHKVIEADGTEAALDILRGEETIDLLFTDVVMPGGINGFDLANRARALRPGLKAVFVSGYAAAALSSAEDTTEEYLRKPYSDEELSRALKRVFEESAPSPAHTADPPPGLVQSR